MSASCYVNIEGTLFRFCSLVKWRWWVSLENDPKKEIGWLMQNLRFRIVAAGWLKSWSRRRRGLTKIALKNQRYRFDPKPARGICCK
jgi:hypothetical protein